MKLQVINTKNEAKGQVELPAHFAEPVRVDLIKRAVVAIQANQRQPYGADPKAGKKHSVWVSRRRRKYRGAYGKGISRVPRKILSRHGAQMYWVGAFAPGTVGGRQAHPPKAEKIWTQKLNMKERQKAIKSAIAATINQELVQERGHKVPKSYPFILDNDFETLSKTKEFNTAFKQIGFVDELKRSSHKHIRAGKGKLRGRKYKRTTGPLIVVSKNCNAVKAARNIPGVDIVSVATLNAQDLAPGCAPGRATLFTKAALEQLK